MAREEADREDLLREATGLVDRVEFTCAWHPERIVAGFRRQGSLSLFLGQAEVYQFTTRGEWRRGYWHGRLLKADRAQLVELIRERDAERTWLVRRELDAAEQTAHCDRLRQRLAQLRRSLQTLNADSLAVHGEVRGTGQDVLQRLAVWLESFGDQVSIAATPHVA